MRRHHGLLVAALLLLVLAPPAGAGDLVQRPGSWAQDYTGRAPDPAIQFGQLPNGLRYAIMHNATPVGHMSLRLDIGSGSLAETRDEQGLAHFLEHMAFRGSTHIADGEMSRMLARYGLGFGADLNATTSQLATVYKFDFPQAGDADIDTGLMLFREIASDLTIDPAAVDAERGVVLSEERQRDTADLRRFKALFDAWMPGQLAPRRWPIGRIDVLQHATAEQLRGFYRREYQPANTVVVAVGDFDPDHMQRVIEARFGDWTATGAVVRPSVGSPVQRGPTAALFSDPAAPASADIAYLRPFDDAAITDAVVARNIKRSLALRILENRLIALTHLDDPPITGASFFQGNVARSANVTELTVNAAPDGWQVAMQAALGTVQRLLHFGATQAELDRVITARKVANTSVVGQAGNRQTAFLADTIVNNAISDAVTRSPAQNAAEFSAVAATTDLAAIGTALHELFSGSGPVALLSTPHPPEGGIAAIRSVLDSTLTSSTSGEVPTVGVEWPYTDFGSPGVVAEREAFPSLGSTSLVRFANGTTLTVKPMAVKGRVAVSVAFGHGRLGLPPALAHSFWLLRGDALIGGGTGKLPIDDVRRTLELHSSSLRFGMDDRTFALKVHTVPGQLDFALQLCAAYLIDPGFRPQAVERAKKVEAAGLPSVDGTEEKVLARVEAQALHGGDPRWSTIPTATDVAATRPEDLRALLGPELRAEPLHVVVVGDVITDQVIASVAKVIGALPATAPSGPRAGASVSFPLSRNSLDETHRGRADQAMAVVAWPTQGLFASPADARALEVAAVIMRQRLVEGLRETDGATYSPSVTTAASEAIPTFGYLAAKVEVPPTKIPLFHERLTSIVADLQKMPVTDDELQRAKQPLVQRRTKQMQETDYWLNLLTEVPLTSPVRDMLYTRVSGIQAVTAQDVRGVVNRFLTGVPFTIQVTAATPNQ